MKFDIKDLPYSQFEQLGMTKRDVLNMKPDELANMLNGGRTSLLSLTIPLADGMKPIQADVKLSLIRNPDNTLSLGVHPIQQQPKNTIDATSEQWEKLLKGEAIVKDAKAYNGTIEPHIFQLDKQTNEILSARINAVQIPNAIKDTVLSTDQKEQLKKGLSLEIENKSTKEPFSVRLDLNEPKGYKVATGEQFRDQEVKTGLKLDTPKVTESVSRGIKM